MDIPCVKLIKQNKIYLSLTLFVLLSIFFIIKGHYYEIGVNTNTVASISVAQKFIRHDYRDAINGAFGPLLSWLLIPLLVVGVNPVLSVYLLNIIIGVLIIIGMRLLSYKFEMSSGIRDIMTFILIPILLYYGIRDLTPDYLILLCMVYYLNFLLGEEYPARVSQGALCGSVAGIGYLAKSYFLPFFIVHFGVINIVYFLKYRKMRRNIVIAWLSGVILFAAICSPWIAILSNKYQHLTIGYAGIYNIYVMGPDVPEPPGEGWGRLQRMGHPVYDQGFFPPSNDTALSVWEDFSDLIPYLKPWSPFESIRSLKHQIRLIIRNSYYVLGIFEEYYSILSLVIILGFFLVYGIPVRASASYVYRMIPLITIAIYTGGYVIIHPEERYLWICNFLILLMGCNLLSHLVRSDFFRSYKVREIILLGFFVLTFITVPSDYVIREPNTDIEYKEVVYELKHYPAIRGKKIASNIKFSETLKVFFYSGWFVKYYGQSKPRISDAELKSDLGKYDIDYYLVWLNPDDMENPSFLSSYDEITGGNSKIFKIYSLKEPL